MSSQKNKDITAAQNITKEQIAAAQAQAQRAGQFGDIYQGIGNTQLGQQNAMLAQYGPQLQQLMASLQGQQGSLYDAAMGQGKGLMDVKQLAEGYSPEAKSALISQAVSGTPGQFDAAISNLKAQMGSRGFGGAGGMGNLAGMMGNIYSAKEQTKAGQLAGITTSEEELRNKNIQANNAANLGNKQAQIAALASALGLGSNLYGQTSNTMGTLANIYNPSQYYGLANQSLGTQTSAMQTGMQGAGILAQPGMQRQGFWDQYGGALMGSGLNLLGDLFKKIPFGGGWTPDANATTTLSAPTNPWLHSGYWFNNEPPPSLNPNP